MVSNFKIQGMPSHSVQVTQFSAKPLSFSSFNFISRSRFLPLFTSSSSSIPINRLRFHSLSLSSSPSPSPSPLSLSDNSSIEHSFEVSYLMSTFGWPPEFATSKVKYLKFKTPEKPERVLAFFKRHKFTESQISNVVKRFPTLLVCNPEKTLFPKFGFLSSLGLSTTEITHVVTKVPRILIRSLELTIIPSFNRLCNFAGSYDEAVRIVKQSPRLLARYQELHTQVLLEAGVPAENIIVFMSYDFVNCQTPTPDNFRRMVEEVKEMGFDPCTMKFLHALRSMMVLGKSTWEDKVQVFKKYGWSDHEISLALKKLPDFIMCSKDRVEGIMDFLVNTMGIKATTLATYPKIFFKVSLEKRIIPRCLVYLSVLEKGLCNREFGIIILTIREAKFITRFIKRYENEAPELWDLYKGLMKLHRLSLPLPSPSPISVFENYSNNYSFEVSYLMSTFGWPPEFAVVKAKKLRFKTPEKPERMLAFLKKHSFTKTQISQMVKKIPRLLLMVILEKTLPPKFEFLSSIGLSITEITDVFTKVPYILNRRLDKIIIPSFNLLCNLVNSNDEALKMIKRCPLILSHAPEADNIQILLNVGVPAANIVLFLKNPSEQFAPRTPDNFRKMVEEIKEMGFDPCTMKFLFALRAIKLTTKSVLEDKMQVLKKCGWSDRNILLALKKHPRFINTSTEKIERVMDFLVNKMGFKATDVCNSPHIFSRSLEKSIIPRCLVFRCLLEKGLLNRENSLTSVVCSSNAKFVTMLIMPYEDEAPELWDLFNGKLQRYD